MSTNGTDGEAAGQNGAEPVYGPGASSRPGVQAGPPHVDRVEDVSAPPYTAPYPPYPSDVPAAQGIASNVAAGLAYFTVIPAVFFLLVEPYREQPFVRFHSWQSIFYFLAAAAARVIEMLMVAMLPSPVAFAIGSLLSLLLFIGWLVAVIKAFQGSRYLLPLIGPIASQTASTTSTRR